MSLTPVLLAWARYVRGGRFTIPGGWLTTRFGLILSRFFIIFYTFLIATFNQRCRRTIKPNFRRYNRSPKMRGCPQKVGICIRVGTTKPKKPNSAVRKIAKIALPNGFKVRAVIPGSGHALMEYNSVWLQAGRARDIPGIHYRLIRGKGDLGVPNGFIRNQRRSKFGLPNWTLRVVDPDNDRKVIFIGNRVRAVRHTLEEEAGLAKTWNTNKYYLSRAMRKKKVI